MCGSIDLDISQFENSLFLLIFDVFGYKNSNFDETKNFQKWIFLICCLMRLFIYGKQTKHIKIEKLIPLARAQNILRALKKLSTSIHENRLHFDLGHQQTNWSLSVSQKMFPTSWIGRDIIEILPIFGVCNLSQQKKSQSNFCTLHIWDKLHCFVKEKTLPFNCKFSIKIKFDTL